MNRVLQDEEPWYLIRAADGSWWHGYEGWLIHPEDATKYDSREDAEAALRGLHAGPAIVPMRWVGRRLVA